MTKKVKAGKKIVVPRQTMAEKLLEARLKSSHEGEQVGEARARMSFRPNPEYAAPMSDFVRLAEAWPLNHDTAVVVIFGTDLKHFVNCAIPMRLMMAVMTELRRLGYADTR